MSLKWIKAILDFLKGIFLYNLVNELYAERRRLEDLIMFSLFGKVIGFPFLFNYYHLRLIPYYVRRINSWKRRTLKERDFFDHIYD